MQFVTNGPDIPDALLQAHEEGRVVFFCGAGISYPAGLPGFEGLVDQIYQLIGTSREPIEEEAYERNQFDATLDLLERRVPGQRIAVRSALATVLQPKLRRKGATETHAALLRLARSRQGALRLVTTNFDRIFEKVAKRTKQPINAYSAPMLPIAKNSRWNGLVYLHGLLPDKPDKDALHRLVLTSGDFGLAYLTERWAARFVSDLFRNYVVCFVGYSINDPVLRYMMDALAADRMLGEVSPQAYALGDCEPGQEQSKTIEWEAKGVTPVLYQLTSGRRRHSKLHSTLKSWAETYRDGVLGKERIVVEYALARPSASTQQDDFVGRMLWALADESGLPAKRFADSDPAPPLDWLEIFSEDRYQQRDLARFEIPPRTKVDQKLRFSLLHRPARYNRSPWMALASGGAMDSQWDEVMFHLARWLVRYLNDPKLIIWIAQRGGQLHGHWRRLIEHELERIASLERKGRPAGSEEIESRSPKAIPSSLMRTLWRLMLTGRVRSPQHNTDLHRWQKQLRRDGLTATLRFELRELLAPKIALEKPFRWGDGDDGAESAEYLGQLVDWKLVLAADDVRSYLPDLDDEHLPELLEEFQQLLRDALDLRRELGAGDVRSDGSHWELPSISPHWQNRYLDDWVTLIERLRDAWLIMRDRDADRATQIAQSWFDLPHSTFKRLALFAASQEGCVAPDQWLDWLIVNDAWWLWSAETRRETMRLLVLQAADLSAQAETDLEAAILTGPPSAMYQNDVESEQAEADRTIWLRLAKLREGGCRLGETASRRFDGLSEANPDWKLASNERDEFSRWMSGTGDPDYEERREIEVAPRKRHDLAKWLRQPQPDLRPFHNYEDTWRETCRTRFFRSLYALCDLAQEGLWPTGRWIVALQVWSEKGMVVRSWRFAAPLMQTAPDGVLLEIAGSVAWWLRETSKSIGRHESVLLDLCNRMLALPYETGVETDRPVSKAINHAVGHVTQALLNMWFKSEPNDDDGLPGDIEPFFTRLCDTRVEQFRHGRVLLASRLIAVFRVDQPWTKAHLLPLFDWASDTGEAKAVWEGFLWSPRLYGPLLIAFKAQFLETACHYEELKEHRRQFAAFLTYAGLDPVDGYSAQDFRAAIEALPSEGLREASQALVQALEGAGEQRENYWVNRVQPFWQKVWPKSRDLATEKIASSFARLSIAARGEFPAAVSAVLDWLQPIEHSDHIVHLLHESGLARRFPEDGLRLLNALIEEQPWAPRELAQCLTTIVEVSPALKQDHRYQRLLQYSRRFGV